MSITEGVAVHRCWGLHPRPRQNRPLSLPSLLPSSSLTKSLPLPSRNASAHRLVVVSKMRSSLSSLLSSLLGSSSLSSFTVVVVVVFVVVFVDIVAVIIVVQIPPPLPARNASDHRLVVVLKNEVDFVLASSLLASSPSSQIAPTMMVSREILLLIVAHDLQVRAHHTDQRRTGQFWFHSYPTT